jgi:chlorite dismutase
MMRSHGTIGHKYHETVTQVIAGSTGLDDWEWGVSLHSEDAVIFKKLVYEMRFDPASALYAEFGPFYLGIRADAAGLEALLHGQPLPSAS